MVVLRNAFLTTVSKVVHSSVAQTLSHHPVCLGIDYHVKSSYLFICFLVYYLYPSLCVSCLGAGVLTTVYT